MTSTKIAYLIPTFEGGDLLLKTVNSIAKSGMPSDSYEIIVSDNCSTDDSIEKLGERDENGARIHVFRATENIGRIENWNKSMEMAENLRFAYATLLMVSDEAESNLYLLKQAMDHAGADLGMGPYSIVNGNDQFVRFGRKIHWMVGDSGLDPHHLMQQTLARGAFLIGQLQANLYRLSANNRLRFNPKKPMTSDHIESMRFAIKSNKPVVYIDKPIFRWKLRKERYHMHMDPNSAWQQEIELIDSTCKELGISPDWPKINATMLLRIFYHAAEFPRTRNISYCDSASRFKKTMTHPEGVSWSWFLRTIIRKLSADYAYEVTGAIRD